ncbi:MAG: endolytic transglycosylase MltG [Anaerolineaceae bacterium]|nr:endolytic transglycosylase MltG [Anaerolineaceae bacterium]
MQHDGLIQNADAFQTYLIYSGLDVTMQAGDYQISSGLNAMEIAQLFQDATPSTIAFGILPGWRLEEVAAALPSSGLAISPKEFLRTALLPATKKGYSWSDAASVEGFILPAIYDVGRDASASELFDTILKGFDEQVTTELRFGISEQGLSLEEAVILASIVEREAVVADEKPVIASVFVNRLALGMRLESDPTVQYAIGFNEAQQTWWKNPLLTNDLKSNSLYNTYLHAGLPPGPICNPSLEALQAVAFPAQTPYYFFRARCDGSGYHDFSVTFEEHLQKACP